MLSNTKSFLRVKAIEDAKDSSKITIRDVETITLGALTRMYDKTNGRLASLPIVFENKKVGGQIELDALTAYKANQGIATGISQPDEIVGKVMFERVYANKVAALKFENSRVTSLTTRVTAKCNLDGLRADALKFYSYNYDKDTFTPVTTTYTVEDGSITIDKVPFGGDIIIVDSALMKKQ